jgi:hypothetical protein
MRENRQSGSEGGARSIPRSYPYPVKLRPYSIAKVDEWPARIKNSRPIEADEYQK